MSASQLPPPRHAGHLLVVADEPSVVELFRRAAEVAFDGDCVTTSTTTLDATLREGRPALALVHVGARDDAGSALVSRIRTRAGFDRVPVVVVGALLGALNRWRLAAAGAFALALPSPDVDTVATVLEETATYARHAVAPAEPSRGSSHLRLLCTPEGHLPIEALLLLIAGAWSGGTLPENALPALLDAAVESGLDLDALDALEHACAAPIPLVDVDASDLFDDARWYLYAFALWISMGAGDVLPRFSPTLMVMAHTLGVAPRMRPVIQSALERQRRAGAWHAITFRRSDFDAMLLPEIRRGAGLTPSTFTGDDDVIEMPDDAMLDDLTPRP